MNFMTKKEKVYIKSNGITLSGNLYKPANLKYKAAVIFTHGLGYCERQYQIDWEYFAKHNYLVLTYNLRAHASVRGEWTLRESIDDLKAVIDFVQHYTSAEIKIGALGHSTGALISLLATMNDPRIKFVSAVTTITCLKDSFIYWFKSGYNRPVKEFFKLKNKLPLIINDFMDDLGMLDKFIKDEIPEDELNVEHRYGMLKSKNWGSFFKEIAFSVDLIAHTQKLMTPIILFRGEQDEIMDPKKTDELYDKIKKEHMNNQVELIMTPSTNHFQNGSWGLIQNKTVEFFDKYLC